MNHTGKIAAILFGAAVLICCALLVRNGLLSIAREIRDVPRPRMPEVVNVKEVTVGQATIQAGRSATNGTNNVKITVENMKLNATNGTNAAKITIENMSLDVQIPQAEGK